MKHLSIDLVDQTCLADRGKCVQSGHVLMKHKKWLLGIALFPWLTIFAGLSFLAEAVAHLFGCHLGIGGF